jgi:hypothetical protein
MRLHAEVFVIDQTIVATALSAIAPSLGEVQRVPRSWWRT